MNEPSSTAGPPAAGRVLVIDDDPTVAEVVAGYLARAGHHVDHAADGPQGLALARAHRPDLVVLDLMLPGIDGLEVLRRLRGQDAGAQLPVVMLTARGDEADRILGLELGADDYVTKPFSPRELVLRVQSVLRRSRAGAPVPGSPAGPVRSGDITLDGPARRARRAERELSLTAREFDLLAFFLRHPGTVFSRQELMARVWGWDFGDLSTVTVHVRRLREKIEDDPAAPRMISTVWGVGYRYDPAQGDGSAPGDDQTHGHDQAPGHDPAQGDDPVRGAVEEDRS
ncbi:response regulator transcription factor [Kitasatospora purpeofusca]|uniref:response regulator transcription factor n=1 Tax=Kitasatospora purpeofusca TaxID=67352 RepID=UPI002A5AE752|nr:response regulator transcription factor [Kitasatospora purpeofusca]MDY0813088.1 response regulator transcription factor [Kitasatospora purpeofusca]